MADNEKVPLKTDKRESVKKFLQEKVDECNIVINKRKRKNKILKCLYIALVSTSIVGSSVVILLSSLSCPPAAIGSVSGLTVVTSALSIKFNLKGKQTKLMNDIQKLHKIKDKLKYVVSCNGNISEEECNNILNEFRLL